ncbi:hypothetical protein B0H13DRAFT_1887068 [Mycena leptocephala]|nr:hypothetical protein B0H13DRAFT_1887068 [Mycena leptocephala]
MSHNSSSSRGTPPKPTPLNPAAMKDVNTRFAALKTRLQLMEALAKVRNSAILDTASARYYLEESQWITKGVPFSRAHLFEILSKISLLPQVSQKSMPETLRALAFMGEDLDGSVADAVALTVESRQVT